MLVANDIGEAIRLLRNRRGWPQKQLAAAAKITRGMLSSYERGKQRPTLVTLDKILKALDADLCDVYCAVELVYGRPAAAHGLSAHFQPGQARPTRLAARKLADARTARTSAGDSGGETGKGPHLPEDIDRAVMNTVSGVETLLRHFFAGTSRPP
jgi:transcriptional regulator with XRE-family HTH domain